MVTGAVQTVYPLVIGVVKKQTQSYSISHHLPQARGDHMTLLGP